MGTRTFRDALEPWNIVPLEAGIDEALSPQHVSGWEAVRWVCTARTVIALAAPCERSTSLPALLIASGSSASNFWRISYSGRQHQPGRQGQREHPPSRGARAVAHRL